MSYTKKNIEVEILNTSLTDEEYFGFAAIINKMVKVPLKRHLIIEIWDEDEFYEYFKLPEMVLKADGKYRPVEGIYMIVKKDFRGIALVNNDNFLSTTVHEMTHAVDFDKYPDWLYRFLNKKWLRKFRKYDPFEKRAWRNQLEYEQTNI